MELKEIKRIIKKLENVMQNVFWKGEKEHPEKTEFLQALSAIQSHYNSRRLSEEKITNDMLYGR